MKDVSTYIAALVEYAVERKLIEGADRVWARNQLLAALALDDWREPEESLKDASLEETLGALLDDAAARGVIGDDITSRDLLERFGRDVTSLNPDWVSICIGINDVWRQFDSPAMPDCQVLPQEYEQNLEKMILEVKGKVKGIFLLSPYYMEPNREDKMRRRMDEYVAICAGLAGKHGCMYVDFQKMYEDYCNIRHSASIAWDRVHPNRVGATLMARAFLERCGFDYGHRASAS